MTSKFSERLAHSEQKDAFDPGEIFPGNGMPLHNEPQSEATRPKQIISKYTQYGFSFTSKSRLKQKSVAEFREFYRQKSNKPRSPTKKRAPAVKFSLGQVLEHEGIDGISGP